MNKDLILTKLQENAFITITELANIEKCSYGKMQKFLKDNNIFTKSNSERLKYRNIKRCTNSPIIISDDANQIIIGSLLGDGSIIQKGTNCIFTQQHSIIQNSYVEYLKELCIKANLEVKFTQVKVKDSFINNRKIKNNGQSRIYTSLNQSFNVYRKEWYPKGKKIIPNSIYQLKALGLAIWFMDDGCFHKGTKNYYFSTDGFCYEDVVKLINMLKQNFNIIASIHKRKTNYVIYITANSRELFKNLIKPYICKEMNYKIFGV